VEDDHVDRLGVEVRQRMKLTSTNRSIGLIVPIAHAHHQMSDVFKTKRVKAINRKRFTPTSPASHPVCVR
jgi:hypothetical protein